MNAAPAPAPAMTEEERVAAIAELLRRADTLPNAPAPVPLGEHMVEAARVPRRHRDALLRLTPTELASVRFLGWGRSNGDIATLMLVSENTVRVHLSNVCRKLDLDGMRELAALAGLLFYPAD
jgi:DNA-binding NarL/FixJ family response regulator